MFILKKTHENQIKKLNEQIADKNNRIEHVEQNWQADRNKFQQETQELKSIAHEALNKLREQTEADLFLSCAKIQKDILNGKNKVEFSQQEDFNRMALERLASIANQQHSIDRMLQYNSGFFSGISRNLGRSLAGF